MDKQTIQELEIIIKAQCENARKDLKKIAQETQNTANKISKSMKTMNNSGALDKVKNNLQEAKNEVKEFSEEVRKIKINDNGFFSFEVKADMSDFEEQYQKALDEYNKKQIEVPVEIKETTTQAQVTQSPSDVSSSNLNNSPEKITVSSDISEIDNIRKALQSAKEEIIELRNQASNLELKGLNPYSILSFRDSLKLLADQATTTIPVLTEFRLAVEQNLSGAFGNSLLQKAYSTFNNLKQKVNELVTNINGKMNAVKLSMTNAFTGVSGSVSSKLSPIMGFFSEVGKVGSGTFEKLKQNLSNVGNAVKKPIANLKQLVTQFKNAKSQSDKVSKSANNFGNSFGKSLKSGINSIKTFALSLLSIRTAFTLISKAANSYLSIDTQLNDSIQNSWNVLGSLLAPALEYVAGLFSKLVNSVASFIKALTGIDLVARANSKALDKQAKSASNASKSLAGIDDIDVLSTSSSSGADENTTITADIDSSPFESMVAKMKDIFSTLFDPIKSAWDNVGAGVIDSMKFAFGGVKDLVVSIGDSLFEVWTNGSGQELTENLLTIFQQIFDIVGGITSSVSEVWTETGLGTEIIQNLFDNLNEKMEIINIIGGYFAQWTVSETFKSTIENILKSITSIQELSNSIWESIKSWVISEDFKNALNYVFEFIDDISNMASDVLDWATKMWEDYLKEPFEKLLDALSKVVEAIGAVWDFFEPVIDWIIDAIENQLEPVIDNLGSIIGGLSDIIGGIADFITGVFTGDWEKAWEGIKSIFQGIWDTLSSIIKTPINGILAGIENAVNAIIKGFNWIKKSLNKISFDIPDWVPIVGGQKWGFNLSLSDNVSLPRLASGNVAYEKTTAIFGEYANARSNPEITSPVSLMKESFRDVLNEFEFGGTRIDTLKIDVAGDNFYQGAVDYINEENIRKGVNIIKEA